MASRRETEVDALLSDNLARAAAEVGSADVLLICAGAGFSADSGLPVYCDVADVPAYHAQGLDYPSLCDPTLLDGDSKDRGLFYGFWGHCLNTYRDTPPHPGYQILLRWKAALFDGNVASQKLGLKGGNGAVYVYTSNVDHHFVKAGFDRSLVREIHGSVERWQCGEGCRGKPKSWAVPSDVRIYVNPETRLAPPLRPGAKAAPVTKGKQSVEQAFQTNQPTCLHNASHQGRPAVLMFSDFLFVEAEDCVARYEQWKRAVTAMLALDTNRRIVVLELGAGRTIPSLRMHSEHWLSEFPSQCVLIRCNPDHDLPANGKEPSYHREGPVGQTIHLRTTGLHALEEMDKVLRHTNKKQG